MKQKILAVAALATLPLMAACATTPGAEVTRFHLADTSMLGHGPISIEAGQGMDPKALEFGVWSSAVAQQLAAVGYGPINSASAGQVAQIRVSQSTQPAVRRNSPVSVGVGGSTGGYYGGGVGLGLGLGIDLLGKPDNQIATELSVSIREKASGRTVWEGRAITMVSQKSALASPQASAQKLSAALFQGFPGNSGETITVK